MGGGGEQDLVTVRIPKLLEDNNIRLKSSRLSWLLEVGKGFPDIGPHLTFFRNAFDRKVARHRQVCIFIYI